MDVLESDVAGEVVVANSDVTGDGNTSLADITTVALAFGKKEGEAGYDARLDINKDGEIDILDITYVVIQMLKSMAK